MNQTHTVTPKALLRLLSPGKCQSVWVRVVVHEIHTVHMPVNKAQVRRMVQDCLGPQAMVTVRVLDADTGGRNVELVKGKAAEPYRLMIGR